MAGWIRLHRNITDHWIFQDAEFFRCWTLMIMDANHQTKKHMFNGALMTIERGQFIFGLEAYERKSGMTIARLRRLLSMLETEGMINRQKTNKFSLISISNYEDYQSDDRQKTSKTQADHKPIATPKECKELEECNNNTNTNTTPPDESGGTVAAVVESVIKPRGAKYNFNDEHYKIAIGMIWPVTERFPTMDVNADKWADAVRKLMEIDHYTQDEIERLWRVITTDEREGFCWSQNCRTPMKLREKKDGLSYFEIIKTQFTGSRVQSLQSGGKSLQIGANQSGGFIEKHNRNDWADGLQ
jgi:hypothetical protein